MAGVGRRRFLTILLALHVHGDLLHHAPWRVVQFLGPLHTPQLIGGDGRGLVFFLLHIVSTFFLAPIFRVLFRKLFLKTCSAKFFVMRDSFSPNQLFTSLSIHDSVQIRAVSLSWGDRLVELFLCKAHGWVLPVVCKVGTAQRGGPEFGI